jgi:hypothetical protein
MLAVLLVQTMWRKHQCAKEMRKRDKHTLIIQAVWRRHRTRKMFAGFRRLQVQRLRLGRLLPLPMQVTFPMLDFSFPGRHFTGR